LPQNTALLQSRETLGAGEKMMESLTAHRGDACRVKPQVDDGSRIRMDKIVYRYAEVRGVSPTRASVAERMADARK
jgi:hypothetical protein